MKYMQTNRWMFAAATVVAASLMGHSAFAQSGPASQNPSNSSTAPAVTQAAASAVASALSGGISSAAGSIGIAGFSPSKGSSSSALATVPTPQNAGTSTTGAWSLAKTGLSAAADRMGVNVWAQGSYVSPKSTFAPVPGTNDTRFDGDVYAGLIGVDTKIDGTPVVVGLAGGYQRVDITTAFNRGTLKQDGYGVSPYVVIGLDKNFFIDLSAGYWWLDTDLTRNGGAIKGQTDGTRWNVGGNLNGSWVEDGWVFGAQIGYLYISAKDDAFTESGATGVRAGESTVKIGQGRVGGTVGYEVEKGIVPYLGGRVEHNFKNPTVRVNSGVGPQPENDKTGYRPMVGLRLGGDGDVSGDISGNTLLGKSDYEEWGVSGTLRLKF